MKAFIKRSSEVLSILLLFAGVILSRVYLFDIYKVPSYSMEPTLLAGDYILVSKAEYGPRVINISRLLFKRELVYRWHRREKNPLLNGLIVFNQPRYGSASSEFSSLLGPVMVKRITCLPGESVRIFRTGMDRSYSNVFPFDTALHWSVDHYGPLYVPRKGDSLELTEVNKIHYATVIALDCGQTENMGIQEGILKGNDAIHCFRFNYYFVTGDNFYMSADSRHWGFVPETHIIGIATRVLFSMDQSATWNKKFRWSRFMKKLA